MRKVLLAVTAIAALSGCTATQQGGVIGGVAGAAVGGAVTGNLGGAIAGGAIGAVAGTLIGAASTRGDCYYRDKYGRRYVARCPAGY